MTITQEYRRKSIALVAIILVATGLSACQSTFPAVPPEPASSEEGSPTATPPTADDPSIEAVFPEGSNEAVAWEALMGPDGEYAAAASYQAVLDEFGPVEPYASILDGELRHIGALTRQLDRMGITVPENPYLGEIDAPKDLLTAAQAWAEGEILNVEMYDRLIAQATDESLIRVLNNLRRASLESHLPAFEQAAANGGTLDSWSGNND